MARQLANTTGAALPTAVVLAAAAELVAQNILVSQVRRQYGMGGITYDYVNDVVAGVVARAI